MPTVKFASSREADFVALELMAPRGEASRVELLVDSGFFGTSALVLHSRWESWNWGDESTSTTVGALQGLQRRGWAVCRIEDLQWEEAVIAIYADLTPMALPAGVDGLAGLTFLRLFDAWGAERTNDRWQFSLSLLVAQQFMKLRSFCRSPCR